MSGRHRSTGPRSGTFDAFDVASRGASLSGRFDAAALPRVAEALALEGGTASVEWRIAGVSDAAGRPALELRLDGAVPLVCQRCLRPFSWTVAQRTLVLLARDERELARLDAEDESEVILAAAPIDKVTLAEDELLLTLPFAPRCGRTDCGAGGADAALPGAIEADRTAVASPFASLADLRTDARKKGRD